jgi:hypothetical protein
MTRLPRLSHIDRAGRAQAMDAHNGRFPLRIRKMLYQEQPMRKNSSSAWLMLAAILLCQDSLGGKPASRPSHLLKLAIPGKQPLSR